MKNNSTLCMRKSINIHEIETCNISELSAIRQNLLEMGNADLITIVDILIRKKAKELMPYNKAHGKSYVKVYKENKKQDKLKKHKKVRRR